MRLQKRAVCSWLLMLMAGQKMLLLEHWRRFHSSCLEDWQEQCVQLMENVQLWRRAASFCLLMLMRGGGTHLLKPWHLPQPWTLKGWQQQPLQLTGIA